MNQFSFFALLTIVMASVYLIVDAFAAKYQRVLASKKAHVRFLEDKIQAERKSLAEFVADVERKAAENKTK